MKVVIFSCQGQVLVRVAAPLPRAEAIKSALLSTSAVSWADQTDNTTVGSKSWDGKTVNIDHTYRLTDVNMDIWTPELLNILRCCKQLSGRKRLSVDVNEVKNVNIFNKLVAADRSSHNDLATTAADVGAKTRNSANNKAVASKRRQSATTDLDVEGSNNRKKVAIKLEETYYDNMRLVADWLVKVRYANCKTAFQGIRSIKLSSGGDVKDYDFKRTKQIETCLAALAVQPSELTVRVNFQPVCTESIYRYDFNICDFESAISKGLTNMIASYKFVKPHSYTVTATRVGDGSELRVEYSCRPSFDMTELVLMPSSVVSAETGVTGTATH